MPASRDHKWFRAALQSVLDQTERDFELIITDDSGGSLEHVVDEVGDERIRYFSNENRLGFAKNHCKALDSAIGRYVAILHDDDVWESTYLSKACTILDQDPKLGYVLTAAVEIDADDKVLCSRPTHMEPGLQDNPLPKFLARDFMLLIPSVTVFRRNALTDNRRPWPEVIAADLTLFIDLVHAGWTVFFQSEELVRYRIHTSQIGMDGLAHRHALVTVWSSYTFEVQAIDDLRKERLASALVARGGQRLRLGDSQKAREDFSLARETWPNAEKKKRTVLNLATRLPKSFIPQVDKFWKRVRDPKATRHQG